MGRIDEPDVVPVRGREPEHERRRAQEEQPDRSEARRREPPHLPEDMYRQSRERVRPPSTGMTVPVT